MEKARVKKLVPIALIAVLSFAIVGNAFAAGEWFQFVFDYTKPIVDYLRSIASFTIEDEPNIPQFVNEPYMIISGSSYVGLEHDVYIAISYTRNGDEYNYWELDADVRAYLQSSDETIAQYAVTNLRTDTLHEYLGTWTPVSPAFLYNLVLDIENYQWEEYHMATYDTSNLTMTTATESGRFRYPSFPTEIIQIGEAVILNIEYSTDSNYGPDTGQCTDARYMVKDEGVTVIDWIYFEPDEYTAGFLPLTASWTVAYPTGPHQVEIIIEANKNP